MGACSLVNMVATELAIVQQTHTHTRASELHTKMHPSMMYCKHLFIACTNIYVYIIIERTKLLTQLEEFMLCF